MSLSPQRTHLIPYSKPHDKLRNPCENVSINPHKILLPSDSPQRTHLIPYSKPDDKLTNPCQNVSITPAHSYYTLFQTPWKFDKSMWKCFYHPSALILYTIANHMTNWQIPVKMSLSPQRIHRSPYSKTHDKLTNPCENVSIIPTHSSYTLFPAHSSYSLFLTPWQIYKSLWKCLYHPSALILFPIPNPMENWQIHVKMSLSPQCTNLIHYS